MNKNQPEKLYRSFDPSVGYPVGRDLFYECQICGESIPSRAPGVTTCKCLNIDLDTDYGRIAIRDHSQVKLYSIRRK